MGLEKFIDLYLSGMLNEHLGNDRVGGSGLYNTIRINFEASTSA